MKMPHHRPRLPRGLWTLDDCSEVLFDFAYRPMHWRSADYYTRCTPMPPDSNVEWCQCELIKLPPEEDMQEHLLRVMNQFVEGQDIAPYLSASGVRHREPLPRELRSQASS